jgi:hypothetical protein
MSAIATYTDLKDRVEEYSERSDLAALIPTFIALAESRFNKEIRVREMESQETLTTASGVATLPSGFLEAIRVTANSSPKRVLAYAPPEAADAAYPVSVSEDLGTYFTIIGSSLKTFPQVAASIELTFYKEITALSEENASNWLLAKAPDIYLFGALSELALYEESDARIAKWGAVYDRAVGYLLGNNARSKAPSLTIRASGAVV